MDPITAIMNSDLELAESLRGGLSDSDIASIIGMYQSTDDWAQKDVAIHLLQECDSTPVEEVMRDALESPTAETRAIAICCICNDSDLFPRLLRDGVVDPALVDEAIRTRFPS